MQTSVHKIIYPRQKCTNTKVQKYMKTKINSEYVCINYDSIDFYHSNDKTILMF